MLVWIIVLVLIAVALCALVGYNIYLDKKDKKQLNDKEEAPVTEDASEEEPVVEDASEEEPVVEEEPEEEPVAEEAPEEEPVAEEEPEEEPVAEEELEEEPVVEEEPEEEPVVEEELEEEPVAEEEPEEEPVAEEAPEEEPVAEEAPEEEPVVEEEPEEEPVAEEEPEEEPVVEEDEQELRAVVQDGKMKYIVIKYSKSFLAKLIQSDERTKNYYSEIKNCLLSYKGVKSRISWKWETFRLGRKTVAKIRLRGKTLSLVMALDPLAYEESKYVVESVADVAAHADTPLLYRIKNDRRLRYAKELIEQLFQDNNVAVNPKASVTDYAKELPYESTVSLIERNLIKELTDEDASSGTMFKPRKSVSAVEVDNLIKDEVAELLVKELNGVSDKTKTGIINIDTLSECFNDGEVVNLEAIKARIPGFDKKATYLKVLARGTLNKELTVEADAFSIEAVKMIVLTGGKVIKK